jgi:predicted nicotinamide N-methyase
MPSFTPDAQDAAAFIASHTSLSTAALVPEIRLHLATELTPLWHATEAFLHAHNMAPPFWAFAWPGSEALARYVTDNPDLVRGKHVLDFAAGGGLAALACLRAGALRVEAAEIDPLAAAAIRLNAAANGVEVEVELGDIVGSECRWDVILCGDVCYEAPMTRHILPWLAACAARIPVIIADPGRKYQPAGRGETLAEITVPTSRELEDSLSRLVVLFSLPPA